MDLAVALAAGEEVGAPVAMVVAHPDDEILGLGSRLSRLHDLVIIHLTDGAPRDLRDARREGFDRWEDYAAARRVELERALVAIGAGHARTRCHAHPDQEAVRHLPRSVDRLEAELAGAAAVVTHPYEHGHPDHDAAALSVALACARLRGQAPVRYEFASYHLRDGQVRLGEFWPDPGAPETELRLNEQELAGKRAAMDCFDTQKALGGRFPLAPERMRRAPAYDFAAPAPPGKAVYERWDIEMTLAEWRRHAAAAMDAERARCA
jgi:LmbE family N-acetylglucosaminyl deacetylase